jgi:hypothetical protein
MNPERGWIKSPLTLSSIVRKLRFGRKKRVRQIKVEMKENP